MVITFLLLIEEYELLGVGELYTLNHNSVPSTKNGTWHVGDI